MKNDTQIQYSVTWKTPYCVRRKTADFTGEKAQQFASELFDEKLAERKDPKLFVTATVTYSKLLKTAY